MGFFDKLFGKNGTPNRPEPIADFKTAKLLDEDKFWGIISKTLEFKDDQDGQEFALINEIKKLSPEEIVGFQLTTDKLLQETYTSEMWCAAYLMNGGCSDDGFEYFRRWLISRGRDTFYKAKENPDNLVDRLTGDEDEFDFESFSYVASEAFNLRTGRDLNDFIDYDNFNYGEGRYPAMEFSWNEDDEESMQKVCPRLYNKFNEE